MSTPTARAVARLYLTQREREFVTRLATGITIKQIAAADGVGKSAITTSLTRARRRNNCATTHQLVARYAVQEATR